MDNSLKSVIKTWLPPAIHLLLIRFATEFKFLSYAHKVLLRKNRELKGMGKGRRAFLLATGPSINQENLKLLAGEDCFSISNFYLHNDIQIINPVFHGFAPYHPPMILENYVEWLRQADRALPSRAKIVLGHQTYSIVHEFGLFPQREVYYIFLSFSMGSCIDLTKPVLGPQTGPLLLLPLMIYMGYERIYLLGCDNTTIRDYKKNITNFYSPEQDIRINTTNSNGWLDIEKEFYANIQCIHQYKHYRDIVAGTSTNIINLSADSWLEMFPFDRLKNIVTR